MRTNVVNAILSLFMVTAISCTSDNDTAADQELIPVSEVEINAQAELLSDQIDDLAEAVAADEVYAAKSATLQKPALPECVMITTTTEGAVTTRVVDFGAGCTMPNGLEYSGKLIMKINRDLELRRADILVETQDFFINGLEVSGTKEITRTWPESVGVGVPSSTVLTDLRVNHPGEVYSEITGTTTREWIAGYGSGTWGDNVVLIGGDRTVKTYVNGTLVIVYEAEITEPLRREWACRFIVSGVVNLSKNQFSATLDYGDGGCDNKALLTTATGATHEIVLR